MGGDTPNVGRVEVFLLGQWGTVCDNTWDRADATVVCHQLGYLRAVGAPRSAAFGAGSGPSWYSNVRCAGTERNLTECTKSFSSIGSACSHSRDAGVVCSGEPPHLQGFSLVKCCCRHYCLIIIPCTALMTRILATACNQLHASMQVYAVVWMYNCIIYNEEYSIPDAS